jgi:hypothetical protein
MPNINASETEIEGEKVEMNAQRKNQIMQILYHNLMLNVKYILLYNFMSELMWISI